MKGLVLLVFVLGLFTTITVCQQLSPSLINKIGLQQRNRFKESINGRTLTGKWGCVQQLFYEPAQCKFFSVPMDAGKMIAQQDEYFQPMTFFKPINQGRLQAFFYSSGNNKLANKLYLLMYKQKYRTGKVIEMDIDLSKSERFEYQPEKNHTKMVAYQQQNVITTANLYENEQLLVKFDISTYIEVFVLEDGYKLMNNNKNNKQHDISSSTIQIRLFSQSISFVSQLKQPQQYRQTIIILSLITLSQVIFICLNPSTSQQNVSKTRSIMFRISQWFILQIYAFIIVFSKEYINLGLKYFDTDIGYLIYLGLGNIGLGLMFLRKYQMVLEKFTNKKMLVLGVIFFCGYWYVASKHFHDPFFWVLELTIMMQLQILHSMINGGKGGLPYDLMGFMIVSRIPLAYMQISEDNLWNRPPIDSQYIKLLISVFIFHSIIILLQSLKGGQFLIPNKIIPGYFNYYITRQHNHPELNQQCPICTSLLSKSPDSIQLTQTIQNASTHHIQQTGQNIQVETTHVNMSQLKTSTHKQDAKTVKIMRTPCNHIFHIDCLTKWMQNKLVCPYCRSTLPQLASLEKQ